MQMQAQWVHAVFFERQHRIVKDHRKHVPPFHNESCTSAAYCFLFFAGGDCLCCTTLAGQIIIKPLAGFRLIP